MQNILLFCALLCLLYYIYIFIYKSQAEKMKNEKLNDVQMTRMKFLDFEDARAGFPYNGKLERTAAKINATHPNIVCYVSENEGAFNHKIICQGKNTATVDDKTCTSLGDTENRMQKTMCVLK